MSRAILLALLLGACGPRMVKATSIVDLRVRRGPPCLIEVTVDGELVQRIEGPNACVVVTP